MKKLIFFLSIVLLTVISKAQTTNVINVNTAGTLNSLLTKPQKDTISILKLTGNIDTRDFSFLRDSIKLLTSLDISAVQIKAFNSSAAKEIPWNAFDNKKSLKKIILPNSITSISNQAFYGCKGLTGDLIIPDSVINIGVRAFAWCTGFEGNLKLGNAVKNIGENAFYGCNFTGELILPDSLVSIGNGSIGGSFSGKLIIPNKVTYIGNYAFSNQEFTGKLILPDSLKTIGDFAFSECSGFTDTIILPKLVSTLGASPFKYCSKIKAITVDTENKFFTSVDGVLFNKDTTSLIQFPAGKQSESYKIPSRVTTLMNYAFNSCLGLTGNLTIPNSVKNIGDFAFYGCSNLTGTIQIYSSDTAIGDNAFYSCGFIGNLTIPASVRTIHSNAFSHCTGLNGTLTIPASINNIEDYAFSGSNFSGIITLRDSALSIQSNTFSLIDKSKCYLKVPLGSLNAYKSALYWRDFKNIFDAYYSVTFFNISHIKDTLVIPGSKITKPADPVNSDFTFAGWFSDVTYKNKWNFDTSAVSSDTILFPKWMAKLSFNEMGGSTTNDTLLNINTLANSPAMPIRKGYIFNGWFVDTLYSKAWDFSTDLVIMDTTLFAKWTKTLDVKTADEKAIIIFPNPVLNQLNIRAEGLKKVTVFNLSGEIILQQKIILNRGNNVIKVEQLKPGNYIVQLEFTNSKMEFLKFVKIR
jgi:uncharacterized repeat protein (TIGR02543 family)